MVKHILIFCLYFFCTAGLKVIYCILFHLVGTLTLPENKKNLWTGAKITFFLRWIALVCKIPFIQFYFLFAAIVSAFFSHF